MDILSDKLAKSYPRRPRHGYGKGNLNGEIESFLIV